ncbi:hypothetical protein [Lysobacter sp. GCM10012299]|uniref:hypothetical protein n=1 Tax=Lysobacter sp. GCM10012299 TaxID=3317333 RepID=UPI0036203750
MKTTALPSVLALAVTMALATACSTTTPAAAADHPSETVAMSVQATGKIVNIDSPSRLVTIEGEDGKQVEVHADETVRNFDQVHVGDVVQIDYVNAVTIDIQPAGSAEPGAYIKEGQDVAKTGEKPRYGKAEVVTVLAPIEAIDTVNNTITVKGPRGNVVTLDVKKPEHQARLKNLKVGDMLRIAFTEAAAVSIKPK